MDWEKKAMEFAERAIKKMDKADKEEAGLDSETLRAVKVRYCKGIMTVKLESPKAETEFSGELNGKRMTVKAMRDGKTLFIHEYEVDN